MISGGHILGLVTAANWGASDFISGILAKRAHSLRVVQASNMVGTPLMLIIGIVMREQFPAWNMIGWAALAGAAAGLGCVALYRGIAKNKGGVVAPVMALVSAAVPVMVEACLYKRPTHLQLAGFAVALVALWLMAGGNRKALQKDTMISGILAGLGVGLFLTWIPSSDEAGRYFTNATANAAGALIVTIPLLIRCRPLLPKRDIMPGAAMTAVLLSMGDVAYVTAASLIGIAHASILASFSPAMTVFLSRMLLKERLSLPQLAGVTTALIAIPLIIG